MSSRTSEGYAYPRLETTGLENVAASASHNHMGLQGLLQVYLVPYGVTLGLRHWQMSTEWLYRDPRLHETDVRVRERERKLSISAAAIHRLPHPA
jgi:hypothetical protein